MKTILDLMRLQLVMMNAKKHALTKLLVIAVIVTVLCALFAPILLLFLLPIAGTLFCSQFSSLTAGTEQLYDVLPVKRSQVCLSRFLIAALYLLGLTVIAMIAAAISCMMTASDSESGENVTAILLEIVGFKNSAFGGSMLLLFAGLAFALFDCGYSVRKAMCVQKRDYRLGIKRLFSKILGTIKVYIIFAAVVFIVSAAKSISFFGSFWSGLKQILFAFAQVGDGALLCIVMLAIGVCAAAYQCVCTGLEYESREI